MTTPSEAVEIYCMKYKAKTASRDIEAVTICDPLRLQSGSSHSSRCNPPFVLADIFLRHSAPIVTSNQYGSPKEWNDDHQEVEQESPRDGAGGSGTARRRRPARLRQLPEGRRWLGPGRRKTAQEISRGESPGEHGPGGERGVRGEGGGSGSEEASGVNLTPNETFDAVRGGARLFLYYDPGTNAFVGTLENTTGNVLSNVRGEVHLSNGAELGPTTPWTWLPAR